MAAPSATGQSCTSGRLRWRTAVGDLSAAALSVLAAVPHWWERRAAAAGLSDEALEVQNAVAAVPPLDPAVLAAVPPRHDLIDATPDERGAEHVCALDSAARNAGGRHYTPPGLAAAGTVSWQPSR